MPWARLDDDFHDNGKILGLSHQAFRLYVCAITYCRRHRSVGFLTREQVGALCGQQRVNRKAVAELVERRAWHAVGAQNHGPSGFQIHDFAEYQPKNDETAAERMRRHRERNRAPGSHGDGGVTVTGGDDGVTRNGDAPVPIPSPIPNLSTSTEHCQEDAAGEESLTTPPAAAERALATPKSLEPRYSTDFEAWWSAYPRKREKVEAFAAYQKTLKAGAAPDGLLAAARNYATAADEQGAEDRFIKLPATFLGPSRPWLDFRDGVPVAAVRTRSANGRRESTRSMLDRVFGDTG